MVLILTEQDVGTYSSKRRLERREDIVSVSLGFDFSEDLFDLTFFVNQVGDSKDSVELSPHELFRSPGAIGFYNLTHLVRE